MVKVPETSQNLEDDTKKISQKSKSDMKIVKFNVKDGKSKQESKIQDKIKHVEEETIGVTTR
jgi:heme-binding NEAT domain protein